MNISAYRENLNVPYFYQDYVGIFASPPASHPIVSVGTERIYLVINGAFWWNPNAAIISVKEQ
jgi:hypothetical protein